ncbi:hypothetical protein SMICM304S_11605 [Streptomyces microflavus]
MTDHRQRDGQAHGPADLEGGAQRDAVHQAVGDHRGGRRQPHLRYAFAARPVCHLAYGEQPLDQMGHQKAADEEQQGGRHPEHRVARGLHRLRQEVQADHAEHQPAREAEHQVAAVRDALRDPAAGQSHQERAERDEHRHGLLLVDRPLRPHLRVSLPGSPAPTRTPGSVSRTAAGSVTVYGTAPPPTA